MDDEIERRLRMLKGGAGEPDAGTANAGAAAESARGAGERRGSEALPGDVIEPGAGGSRGPGAGGPQSTSRRPGPAVRAVTWSIDEARAGRLRLWFGVGLLAFGGYLVAVEFVPALRIAGSLVLLAAGVWALGWRATGRAGTWALYVGAVLAGYGAGGTVATLVANGSGGWGSLGVGVAFLAIAGWRAAHGGGIGWQAWIGVFLVLWGGWGALGSLVPGFPTAGDLVVPLILVLVGALFLRRGFR